MLCLFLFVSDVFFVSTLTPLCRCGDTNTRALFLFFFFSSNASSHLHLQKLKGKNSRQRELSLRVLLYSSFFLSPSISPFLLFLRNVLFFVVFFFFTFMDGFPFSPPPLLSL